MQNDRPITKDTISVIHVRRWHVCMHCFHDTRSLLKKGINRL